MINRWLVVAAGALTAPAAVVAQAIDRAAMVAAIDSVVMSPVRAGRIAGVSVAVVKGRDTILIKGYGKADLDLDVPTPDDAIYEIGSVTKQFTVAAIMQLVEQGKLSLDDELTKFLPDYPTQGNKITIRRLLDHTSGIKGYTEIPRATRLFPLKMPKDSIVAIFSSMPFEFAPGERLVYNNSAYFLAGLIIEKVSGMTYGDYVQRNLFAKAGMGHSSYCSESEVVKGKAHGYGYGPNGLRHAYQSDHSWPYSAGSLCSTARDLATWLGALHTTDKVVSRDSYREMITPGTLNDGTRLRYAKGLTVVEEDGRRMIGHGGGISGFVSETRYYPDNELSIVVLINTAGGAGPADQAQAIARIVLGPGKELPARSYSGDLAQFAGTYRGVGRGQPINLTIRVEGGELVVQQGPQQTARPLKYQFGDTFAGSTGRDRYTFIGAGGKVVAVQVDLVSVVSRLDRSQ